MAIACSLPDIQIPVVELITAVPDMVWRCLPMFQPLFGVSECTLVQHCLLSTQVADGRTIHMVKIIHG